MKKMLRRLLSKLSGRFLLGYTLVMFTIGATPVFAGFFLTMGVSASTIVLVAVTAIIMVGIAFGIVFVAEVLKRWLFARLDEIE